MDAFRTIMLAVHLGSSAIIMAISLPLIRRKVPPNSAYGFRVRRTLADPVVWYEANEFAGRCLFGFGVWIALNCLALYFVPAIDAVGYAIACLVVTMVGLGVSLALSFRFLGRLTAGRNG